MDSIDSFARRSELAFVFSLVLLCASIFGVIEELATRAGL